MGARPVHARLGPDPLRCDADPGRFVGRLTASRAPVAGLLVQQEVIAGVGNVYRRTGLPCRRCGAPVRTAQLAGRNLYWCPVCQQAA